MSKSNGIKVNSISPPTPPAKSNQPSTLIFSPIRKLHVLKELLVKKLMELRKKIIKISLKLSSPLI